MRPRERQAVPDLIVSSSFRSQARYMEAPLRAAVICSLQKASEPEVLGQVEAVPDLHLLRITVHALGPRRGAWRPS